MSYNALKRFTSDGVQTSYNFGFDYLRKAFITVTIFDSLTSESGIPLVYGSDFSVSGQDVILTAPVTKGKFIEIRRVTQTSRIVTWNDASVFRAADMTTFEVQLLHLTQEANDTALETGTVYAAIAKEAKVASAVSEANAKVSEENAKMSEANAKVSEENAKMSEAKAKVSEENAKASQEAAADSATKAANSASNAAASETNAKLSEENAASSAALALGVAAPEWDSATLYNYPTVVAYIDGYTYRCIGTNVLGEVPSLSANWVRAAWVANDFFEMDGEGDLMPALSPTYSVDFELDEDGDIMPKE